MHCTFHKTIKKNSSKNYGTNLFFINMEYELIENVHHAASRAITKRLYRMTDVSFSLQLVNSVTFNSNIF